MVEELATSLESDLGRRAAELEDALATTDIDAAKCASTRGHNLCCLPKLSASAASSHLPATSLRQLALPEPKRWL